MIDMFGPIGVRYSSSGRPAVSSLIRVVNRGTNVSAPLFTDTDGLVPAANPVLTDDLGNLTFFAEPGEYDMLVNGARIKIELDDYQTLLLRLAELERIVAELIENGGGSSDLFIPDPGHPGYFSNGTPDPAHPGYFSSGTPDPSHYGYYLSGV